MPLALRDFVRGPHDQLGLIERQLIQFAIGDGRAFLQDAERANDCPIPAKAVATDGKILAAPLSLSPPQMICGNVNNTERVLLGPNVAISGRWVDDDRPA